MKSQNRRHDRTNFFKYLSAGGAIAVLKNRSLRWSSPVLFNDPFDVPREITVGINPDDIRKATNNKFAELIKNPPIDTSHLSPKLRGIIEAVKAGIPEETLKEILSSLDSPIPFSEGIQEALNGLREQWKGWIPDFRILCLTESPDHVAMWHHYADKYRGVVLGFRCLDETDTAMLAAEKVSYSPEASPLFTADAWADILMLKMRSAIDKLFKVATTTKASDWQYENEWRVITYRGHGELQGQFSDYPFHPQDLESIFFGPEIPMNWRIKLIKLASRYPNVSLVDVSFGNFGKLEFSAQTSKQRR